MIYSSFSVGVGALTHKSCRPRAFGGRRKGLACKFQCFSPQSSEEGLLMLPRPSVDQPYDTLDEEAEDAQFPLLCREGIYFGVMHDTSDFPPSAVTAKYWIHCQLPQPVLPRVSATAIFSFPGYSKLICFLGLLQKINLGLLRNAFWILFPGHLWITSTPLQPPVLQKVKAAVIVVSTILWMQFWIQDVKMLLVRVHLLWGENL